MIIFKIIYKISVIYGHCSVINRNTKELLELLGINVTSILEMVTGPEL